MTSKIKKAVHITHDPHVKTRSKLVQSVAMVVVTGMLFGLQAMSPAVSAAVPPGTVTPALPNPDRTSPPVDEIPAEIGHVLTADQGVPESIALSATSGGVVQGLVSDAYSIPVASAVVNLTATSPGNPTLTATTSTAIDGTFLVSLELDAGTYTLVARVDLVESAPVIVTSDPVLTVHATIPAVASEQQARLRVVVTSGGRPVAAAVDVRVREPVGADKTYAGTTGADGIVAFNVKLWHSPSIEVVATRRTKRVETTIVAHTTPASATIDVVGPQPRTVYPLTNQPQGPSGNARISRLSSEQWAAMRNVSWQEGCVPRSRLRSIDVNYRGFDGYRHRGRIIVQKSIAAKTARVFNRLHSRGYPIRQIAPVDRYGKNIGRPGANDYLSMAADNTSGFNCRYVVGKERSKVRSPHSSGRSIDINPWENPYVAPNGVFPDRYYLSRWRSHPAMFKGGRSSLRTFRQAGCRWGGSYSDFHHFDC